MAKKPNHSGILTAEFFNEHYVKQRMSYPKLREMLLRQGHNIHIGTLRTYAIKHGIGRTRSEAKRNVDLNPLNYELSFMTEHMIEIVDGFLLGDGHIEENDCRYIKSGRASCSLEYEEFCNYLINKFLDYCPSVIITKSSSMKSGVVFRGFTKFHPDLYIQRQRWYTGADSKKQPPNDVRITPLSVMMWYLGDGSITDTGTGLSLRLSTDGFSQEGAEFLASKLNDVGIDCHRNGDNRIFVEAKGIPAFFDFIGRSSPVKCYEYKFDLPEWRFESKRMSEVAEELGIDYQKLAYWVKIGKVPCYRETPKGKPRFLNEHIMKIKEVINELVSSV